MADQELFGAQPQPAAARNGALDDAEEDPAAAFLAQQENEIAGIENDEGYDILEDGEVPDDLDLGAGIAFML
ncbi:clathrin light polypeptide variant 1a [Limosa lapponica baueri]|uniref:Clathrin light polypeptide variant 1a n=1 Tax=Limosa lapponica baueri TaxID=1758121 RepID=A0A2I0UH98_LIMLA|nr:clathrin light polypeptide variant 1a [Limosa lapponica baueri]